MSGALAHDALIYESDAEFVDALAPFILAGLDLGEGICVVTSDRNCELLQSSIGERGDAVVFVDAMGWYQSPARTIAAYDDMIHRAVSSGAPGLRAFGELDFGETAVDHAEWTRYESVVNLAFRSRPATMLCGYDARSLPESIVDDARRTHPHTTDRDGRRSSHTFAEPTEFIAPIPLAKPGRLLEQLETDSDLRAVRELVRRTAAEAGFGAERAEDLCLAVTELATNAIEHGRAPVQVQAWSGEQTLVYEVTDCGNGPTHSFLGFIPPDPFALRGRGLWISRQLTDRLEIATTSAGTSALVEVARAG